MSKKAFDFKKEYKDLYLPSKNKPMFIEVPAMNFIMVDGSGDPNNNSEFQQAIALLYGLSFTIKMSKMKGKQPDDYFEYVVPPLEGLWWVEGESFSFSRRDNWKWTLMIRQPDFVSPQFFEWAGSELKEKKPDLPIERSRFAVFEEGLCVQIMHIGPYADEPQTMKKLADFIAEQSLKDLLASGGKHHEIYLSDPTKSRPENIKTVLRHPVSKV
ncbi:MAG: GyrI-like domain-containing protein [Bacillota bacterium]|jgi:hypothetical protein